MTMRSQTAPLAPNAFIQAVGQAEAWDPLEKMRSRYQEHKGSIDPEKQKHCEDAIARQEQYLLDRGITRPEKFAPVKPSVEDAVKQIERASLSDLTGVLAKLQAFAWSADDGAALQQAVGKKVPTFGAER